MPPLQAVFASFRWGKTCKNGACGRPQAVLAMLLQISRRGFACCTSLGECLTTHKGVTARFLLSPSEVWLCRAFGGLKKLPEP